MKILGLSFFYHDAAAALLVDGVPVALAEEERFSRKKNDPCFPASAIRFVLEAGGLSARDLDYAVFYEKPFLKLDRVMKTNLTTFPLAPHVFVASTKSLFLDKLWIRSLIARDVGVAPERILFAEHHPSHAASAFFASPYDEAAILTIDGVGEWAVTTIGVGRGRNIEVLKEIHFPHSLGLLYSAFTAFLGFEVNEGEYKVMGMAPYGKPRFVDDVKKLITFFPDGSYQLNLDYFSFHRSLAKTYSAKFVELFGKPRDPKSHFFTRETGWPAYFGEKPTGAAFDKLAEEQERYADIAASVQSVLEEAVVGLAREARRLTGMDRLCFAGGVALNSVANWKILTGVPFRELFIQPAAGDAGGALGAALLANVVALGGERRYTMANAYYGASYSNEEVEHFLQSEGIRAKRYAGEKELIDTVVQALVQGKVVGWFHGRFEWGPRALGSRSILADPRRADMKDIVNTKIKFREPYRPFAPSVLAERAEEVFEMPRALSHYPARFMLYVVGVRPEKRSVVPAITHVDGTARPQLVYREESPRYYRLIERFAEVTGVPLVLNTSFNLKGEPIVGSPRDAYQTFSRSGLDLLVLEDFIVTK